MSTENGTHFANTGEDKNNTPLAKGATDEQKVDLTARVPRVDSQQSASQGTGQGANQGVDPFVTLHSDETKLDAATTHRHTGSLARIIVVALIVLVGGTYAAGVWGASHYFPPNTTLNDENVSLQSAEQVARNHTMATEGYTLKVSGDDFELEIAEKDINLRSDGDAYVEGALKQIKPLAWPIEIMRPHRLTSNESITFDHDKANEIVKKALDEFNAKATQPTDASLSYDKNSHSFTITPEQIGTALDSEQVTKMITDAITNLEHRIDLTDEQLKQPTLKADDKKLKTAAEDANKKLSATQKLTVGDKDVINLTTDDIAKWIKLDDKYQVSVDSEAITNWARGELSDKFDSVGASRNYTRPDGKQATVKGGSYGWTIDGGALGQQISDNIKNGTNATIDIPMSQKGETWNPGGQDWGKRYIDIDISEQHVRLFDTSGAIIWESDCVTGNPNKNHSTPEGVYQINNNKETGDVQLEGPIDDKTGEPEYISHVTYWMPFVWNAVALHDASWRYSFGGEIYKSDGSHGCVNLPSSKAAELYNLCQVDDVVVVHY